MYKQIGLAILIIAPLVADFAARHSGAPAAAAAPVEVEGLPPGAIEVKNPHGEGQAVPPAQPMAANMLQNGQVQTVPGLGAGIDPMPTLDPTPGGATQNALPPAAPQPEVQAPTGPQFIAPPQAAMAMPMPGSGMDGQAAPAQ